MSFYSKYAGEEVEQRLDAVSEIAGQVGDISGALSEVSGKVGEVSEHLASVDASVVAVGNKVDGVVASVDGVSSRVDANATNIAEVAEKVGSIEKDVDVIDESVGALGERVQELGSLTTSVENLSANVTAIGRGVEQLAERVENVASELDNKQGVLESGVNVKTINGESILGAGDIKVQGGGIGGEVEDVTEIQGNEFVLLMDGDKVLRVPMSVLKAWLGVPSEPDQPDEPTTPDVDENGYIVFADAEVQRICAENWGDGAGITEAQIESVTTWGYTFQNSNIVTFDDAYKFGKVTKLESSGFGYGGAFNRCTSLTSITLPTSITEIQGGNATYGGGDGAFYGATSLARCVGLENVTYIGTCSFYNCPALTDVDIDWNKVTYIGDAAFTQCKINVDKLVVPNLKTLGESSLQGIQAKVVADLGEITSLPYHWYSRLFCDNVECVVLPDTLTSMDTHSMYMDRGFNTLVMKAVTPPTIQDNTFMQLPSSAAFYVPDASVEAYKTATNWSTYASRIKGIGELPTDNAELYDEIKDYLN